VGSRFALLAALEENHLGLPVHRQGEIRMKAVVPGAGAVYCFDIDHQDSGLRDLITKGQLVAVFPRLSCADLSFDAHVQILQGSGVSPPLCVRVAGKMDDGLAANPSPATIRS
jgi:hypothetical protein